MMGPVEVTVLRYGAFRSQAANHPLQAIQKKRFQILVLKPVVIF